MPPTMSRIVMPIYSRRSLADPEGAVWTYAEDTGWFGTFELLSHAESKPEKEKF